MNLTEPLKYVFRVTIGPDDHEVNKDLNVGFKVISIFNSNISNNSDVHKNGFAKR